MRSFLYWVARLLGDVDAVKKGRAGRRLIRRAAGWTMGGLLRRLFR
jgi:hypothetical protein